MGPQGRQVRALKATLFRRPDLLGLCVLGRKHSHVIPGALFPGTVLCITTSPFPLGVLRSRTLLRLQDGNILQKKSSLLRSHHYKQEQRLCFEAEILHLRKVE